MFAVLDRNSHYAEKNAEGRPTGTFSTRQEDAATFNTMGEAERFMSMLRAMFGPSADFNVVENQ